MPPFPTGKPSRGKRHDRDCGTFFHAAVTIPALSVMFLSAAAGAQQPPVPWVPKQVLSHAGDYTFGFYPGGWRLPETNTPIRFAVQTNRYGLLLNAGSARIEKLGPFPQPYSGDEAVTQGNGILDRLPDAALTFSVVWQGHAYPAALGPTSPEQVRLYHVGKYLQHFDLQTVQIGGGSSGAGLAGVSAWIDGYCWSDRIAFQLYLASYEHNLAPPLSLESVQCAASLAIVPQYPIVEAMDGIGVWKEADTGDTYSMAVLMRNTSGAGIALVCVPGCGQSITRTDDNQLVVSSAPFSLTKERLRSFPCILVPSGDVRRDAAREAHSMRMASETTVRVSADGIAPYTGALNVTYDPVKGWHQVVLGENPDKWKQERVRLHLSNAGGYPCTVRLNMAKIGGSFSITGMSPVLLDGNGYPVGLPVQISKNWHISPTWFNGITMLDLDAGQQLDLEFALAYGMWGGVPAVSHAQLCLVGYAKNQLWDEMAIGSFGESICYDPDVNLGRSMVDDMRPLMVWSVGTEPERKWDWTHNVGGCDFLTLFLKGSDSRNLRDRTDTTLFSEGDHERVYLVRQKTRYATYCPVLSDVTYAGETPGGEIQSRIRTQSWRSDDYVRALYTIRYDVKTPLQDIERLAFFQLGADNYNWMVFDGMARGTVDGVEETWVPPMGGLTYSRRGEPLTGTQPWISLYGVKKEPANIFPENDCGGMANKGMIVRSRRARLGGRDCPTPYYSVFGSMDRTARGLEGFPEGMPGALVELSPPPGLDRLEPGDFVETQVEVLILPQTAEAYYGPDTHLSDALRAHPDDWHLVHREAVLSNIEVTCAAGKVEQRYPVRIRAEAGRRADFTIVGGVGYTPVTITGASAYAPCRVTMILDDGGEMLIDESSDLGNDWWQADFDADAGEWEITYTLPLGGEDGIRMPHRFVWSQEVGGE